MIRSSRRQGCVSTVYCLSVAIGGRAWDNFKYFLPKVATPDDYIRNNVIRYIDDYKRNRLNYVLRFIEGMSAADLEAFVWSLTPNERAQFYDVGTSESD